MTRQDAILAISQTWSQRDAEFCVGDEHGASEKELEEALAALGVTKEEHEEAWKAAIRGE